MDEEKNEFVKDYEAVDEEDMRVAEQKEQKELAVQFASGEGLSQEELSAVTSGYVDMGSSMSKEEADKLASDFLAIPEIDNFDIVPTSSNLNWEESHSTAYLDARLTLLEQAQTEFEERVARTFKEAGFKF